MSLSRDQYTKQIADRLHELANKLKTRTRANLTDANHSLETVMRRFFNALHEWNLIDLNGLSGNFPAADLGDKGLRIAMQITNEGAAAKISRTSATAVDHKLGNDYDRLIIFFLLERKPAIPKNFAQPRGGPFIETLDITELLQSMGQMQSVDALRRAASVLEEEMKFDVPASALQRYLAALHEHFSTYENLGLPTPANARDESDVRIAIRELFVEPTCTEVRVSPEDLDAALLAGNTPASPLLRLLAGEDRRIVLLADPGMGKSTLIQWLVASLAEQSLLPANAAGLRGVIPLPFIVRDLVPHLPKSVEKWDWPALLRAFTSYHPRAAGRPPLAAAIANDESFRDLLASDRAFFLIDGIDELGDVAYRRALRDALWQGFALYPSARWLITSRWVGYGDAAIHSDSKSELIWPGMPGRADDPEVIAEAKAREFVIPVLREFDPSQPIYRAVTISHARLLYLAPFDDRQQASFARHWYIPRMGEATGSEHAGRFVEAVRRHPAVRVIGRIPNLLYLLALLYRHRAHLPHGRTHVYTAISEAYLGGIDLGIDAARGTIDAAKRLQIGNEYRDKVRLLATVACQMQKRRAAADGNVAAGEILVERAELEQWLRPHFFASTSTAALDSFIGYVAARSGLLLPRGEGFFGFAHLSFLEYYAACWLEDEFRRLLNAGEASRRRGFLRSAVGVEDGDSLTRRGFGALASLPIWREPLMFLVEKLSANVHDTESLIAWLFPQLLNPVPIVGKKGNPEIMPIEAARLLVAISLNPHVALDGEQREVIWRMVWKAYIRHFVPDDEWHIPPALFSASEFQPQVWEIVTQFPLQRLSLYGCSGLTDIIPIARWTQLKFLSLGGCSGVTELSPLSSLKNVEMLSLSGCFGIKDIAPLANLTNLVTLSLEGCRGVKSVEALADLKKMRWLSLDGCLQVDDIAPLSGASQLLSLSIRGCSGVGAASVAALREKLPMVQIYGP